MLEINILPVTVDDIDELLEIEERSFTSPWSYGMFMMELDSQLSKVFAARGLKKNCIYGYICFSLIIDEMHITNIAVDKPYRRKNVARRLLEFSMETAKADGAKYAFLEVRSTHKAALSLYEERLGFIRIGLRKKYYSDNNEDAVIMIKYL